MTVDELKHLYFEWMYRLVCDDRYTQDPRSSHRTLLKFLHEQEFIFDAKPGNDDQRALDGIDLRYYFAEVEHHDPRMVAKALDVLPCSMLEMMIALAIRCEDMMEDRDYGNRTGQWFWEMLESLGLAKMTDSCFDEEEALDILDRFYRNDYDRDGRGGLFTVKNCPYDMREQEITWQMYEFLNTYYC